MKDINKIFVDGYRKNADNNEWDDIPFLSDEEVLKIDSPTTDELTFNYDDSSIQYSEEDLVRLYELDHELNEVLEEIKYCENKLSSDINYLDRVETRAEMVHFQARQQRIEAEIRDINAKYVTRNRSLH